LSHADAVHIIVGLLLAIAFAPVLAWIGGAIASGGTNPASSIAGGIERCASDSIPASVLISIMWAMP
jgi:hypothetical protein